VVLGLLIGGCAVFGLVAGSFVHLVISRVPRQQPVLSGLWACPRCDGPQAAPQVAPEAAPDAAPAVVWLFLRGRCRRCHHSIPMYSPLVELAAAGLAAATAARFGFAWALPAFLVLGAGLLALSCIDVSYLLLPRKVVYPLSALVAGLLVMAAAATGDWHDLWVAGLCGLAWFVVFLGMNLASPRVLGFGDVRLAPVLGLSLGWLGVSYVFLGFVAANLLGAVVGLTLIMAKRIERKQQIPYGVFLSLGVGIAVFAGPELLRHFPGFQT
jgi:leader peptidase (prepilin peptidase) / N-methyltransferase